MKGFKIQRDPVAGLCGSCAGCETQITMSGRTIVRCAINNGRRVPEPLSFCSDYHPSDVFKVPFPQWMHSQAWLPIEHKNRGEVRRTFIAPDRASDEVRAQIGFGAKWARSKRS